MKDKEYGYIIINARGEKNDKRINLYADMTPFTIRLDQRKGEKVPRFIFTYIPVVFLLLLYIYFRIYMHAVKSAYFIVILLDLGLWPWVAFSYLTLFDQKFQMKAQSPTYKREATFLHLA